MIDLYRIKHEISDNEIASQAILDAVEVLKRLEHANHIYQEMIQDLMRKWCDLFGRRQELEQELKDNT